MPTARQQQRQQQPMLDGPRILWRCGQQAGWSGHSLMAGTSVGGGLRTAAHSSPRSTSDSAPSGDTLRPAPSANSTCAERPAFRSSMRQQTGGKRRCARFFARTRSPAFAMDKSAHQRCFSPQRDREAKPAAASAILAEPVVHSAAAGRTVSCSTVC